MTAARGPAPLPPFVLNDGATLPAIGLGTFGMRGSAGVEAITAGLEAGYRLLDTSSGYRNEPEVGEALRRTTVRRSEIRVTTKLLGPDHPYERARQSIRDSRQRLGGHPVDLYLIHWPNPRKKRFVEAWQALIDAREAGDVISIGVSNFERPHLEAIIDATGVVPAVDQVELHPHFVSAPLRALHVDLGIVTESWSPLGLGQALDDPVITAVADDREVTAAQVVLRWHHQLGCLPVPRSSDPRRQAANLDIAGFALTEQEVERISALGRPGSRRYGRLWGGDPATEER